MKSNHEEINVVKKQQQVNDEMKLMNTKKRKYESDALASNVSLNKLIKVTGDTPIGKELTFPCDQCDYKTHGKRPLKNHMKLIHKKLE